MQCKRGPAQPSPPKHLGQSHNTRSTAFCVDNLDKIASRAQARMRGVTQTSSADTAAAMEHENETAEEIIAAAAAME